MPVHDAYLEELRGKLAGVHQEFSEMCMDEEAISRYLTYRGGFRMDKSWSLPKGAMCRKELSVRVIALNLEISKAELDLPKKLEELNKFREEHAEKKSTMHFEFPSLETDFDRPLHIKEDLFAKDQDAVWGLKEKLHTLLCNNYPIDAEAFHDKMKELIDKSNDLLYRIRIVECANADAQIS